MFPVKRLFQIITVATRRLSPPLVPICLRALTFGLVSARAEGELPRAVRETFEELGGAFVKLGQILAMRADLLPREYLLELAALLDAVPPFGGDIAARVVEQELGAPLDSVFQSFDHEAIAAASFAQVHTATLGSGERVVVKVQRPGLRRQVDADVRFVMLLARLVDFLGLLNRVRVRVLAEEFKEWTEEELDLRTEATYAQRLRDATSRDPHCRIPKVHWDYTTRSIFTMEYLDGVWLSEVLARIDAEGPEAARTALAERGIDLDAVASNLLDNQLRQTFEHQLYHADPHAGNLVILKDNVIGYVDFGITGQLDAEFRDIQLQLYDALHRRDLGDYMRSVYRMIKPPPDNVDLDAFERQIKRATVAWQNVLSNPRANLQERCSSWLFMRNIKDFRKYGIEVSQVALRYYRAFSMFELLMLRLSPTFDIVKALATYMRQSELRTLAREVRIEAQIRQLFQNRRLLDDGLAGLRRALDTAERPGVARLRVSRWRLAMAAVFRVAAVVAALTLAGVVVRPALFDGMAPWLAQMGRPRGAALLVAAWLFCAWMARRLYISGTRHGTVERYL
ncbi:MAG: ABC1 kinase family protein [Vicinamibacterales bacterium]